MICAVIKGPTLQDAQEQISYVEKFADLLEYRIDLLDPDVSSKLSTGLPILYTDGVKDYSYGYKELNSFHDFEKTPVELFALDPFDKISTFANSTLDALRMLLYLKEQKNPKIALCMGEAGKITRILGPVVGAPWTYAAPFEGAEAAPGQLTAEKLCATYRYRSLNPETRVFGLIGDPVKQSIGDVTHNGWYDDEGINAVYVKMPVKPEELGEFVELAKQFGFSGLSVTMPLKVEILKYLDLLDEEAEVIGSVNTIVLEEGLWKGYNTDGLGALDFLEQSGKVTGRTVAVLGTGGTAKAVAFEAEKRGAKVTFYSRKELENLPQNLDIAINCTPADLKISANVVMHAKGHLQMFLNQAKQQHQLFSKSLT